MEADFLQDETVVSRLELATFFSKESGTPVGRTRTSHALVWYLDCVAVYRFSNGEVLNCRSGDCIFLPKGSSYTAERHMERDNEKRGIYAISFQLFSDEDVEYTPFVMHVRGREEMQRLFAGAVTAWRMKGAGYCEECLSRLYRILGIMKQESSVYSPTKRTLEILAPALRYIREHFTEESVSVGELASLCKVSEPYLRRLFHNAFSVSPAVYMRNLRIEYAKELLLLEEYSVTDAALLSGFNDTSYFSREFKKAVGESPSDYRRTR